LESRYLCPVYRKRDLSRADNVLNARDSQKLKAALEVDTTEDVTGKERDLKRFDAVRPSAATRADR
jgi:hypothetical protein